MKSWKCCARSAAKSKNSARVQVGTDRFIKIERKFLPSSVAPGSLVATTCKLRLDRTCVRFLMSVVLPQPSVPSTENKKPCFDVCIVGFANKDRLILQKNTNKILFMN